MALIITMKKSGRRFAVRYYLRNSEMEISRGPRSNRRRRNRLDPQPPPIKSTSHGTLTVFSGNRKRSIVCHKPSQKINSQSSASSSEIFTRYLTRPDRGRRRFMVEDRCALVFCLFVNLIITSLNGLCEIDVKTLISTTPKLHAIGGKATKLQVGCQKP